MNDKHKWMAPIQVQKFSKGFSDMAQVMVKEVQVTKKTLISFCVQIPPIALFSGSKPESIFKSSRLMLHEIVDP